MRTRRRASAELVDLGQRAFHVLHACPGGAAYGSIVRDIGLDLPDQSLKLENAALDEDKMIRCLNDVLGRRIAGMNNRLHPFDVILHWPEMTDELAGLFRDVIRRTQGLEARGLHRWIETCGRINRGRYRGRNQAGGMRQHGETELLACRVCRLNSGIGDGLCLSHIQAELRRILVGQELTETRLGKWQAKLKMRQIALGIL